MGTIYSAILFYGQEVEVFGEDHELYENYEKLFSLGDKGVNFINVEYEREEFKAFIYIKETIKEIIGITSLKNKYKDDENTWNKKLLTQAFKIKKMCLLKGNPAWFLTTNRT